MIHIANTALCGCATEIMCVVDLMTNSVLGEVVCLVSGYASVFARTVITGWPSMFRHAAMIIAAIMAAGCGSGVTAMSAVIAIACGAIAGGAAIMAATSLPM